MSAHAFGWLGRRRHAAEPLAPWHSRAAAGLPLRPLLAVAPQRPDPVGSHAEQRAVIPLAADPSTPCAG